MFCGLVSEPHLWWDLSPGQRCCLSRSLLLSKNLMLQLLYLVTIATRQFRGFGDKSPYLRTLSMNIMHHGIRHQSICLRMKLSVLVWFHRAQCSERIWNGNPEHTRYKHPKIQICTSGSKPSENARGDRWSHERFWDREMLASLEVSSVHDVHPAVYHLLGQKWEGKLVEEYNQSAVCVDAHYWNFSISDRNNIQYSVHVHPKNNSSNFCLFFMHCLLHCVSCLPFHMEIILDKSSGSTVGKIKLWKNTFFFKEFQSKKFCFIFSYSCWSFVALISAHVLVNCSATSGVAACCNNAWDFSDLCNVYQGCLCNVPCDISSAFSSILCGNFHHCGRWTQSTQALSWWHHF